MACLKSFESVCIPIKFSLKAHFYDRNPGVKINVSLVFIILEKTLVKIINQIKENRQNKKFSQVKFKMGFRFYIYTFLKYGKMTEN